MSVLSAISESASKMENLCGYTDVESVKHIVISRPIIMVDMSARTDEFQLCLESVSG